LITALHQLSESAFLAKGGVGQIWEESLDMEEYEEKEMEGPALRHNRQYECRALRSKEKAV
jgi:hypothetical protein